MRLDFFLISDGLVTRTKHSAHAYSFASDHSMVTITLQTKVIERGHGFWKFNSKLLENKLFVEAAQKVIETASKKYYHSSPSIKWEMIKCEIIAFSKSFSSRLAKKKKTVMANLE